MTQAMMSPESTNWWRLAACAGHDPDWWSDDAAGRTAAVQICLACPVRQRCLDDALARRDVGVVRGGTWLNETSRGYVVTPLICTSCGSRPVQNVLSRSRRRQCLACEWRERCLREESAQPVAA